MKTLKCDLCDHEAQGETFEEWMMALRPHYMEAHADVMKDPSKGEEERAKWMADNKARFDDEYGKVYTTLVAPGDYDFWASVNNPYYKYTDPEFTESIRLNPGEIKYIGEFFVLG